MEDTNKDKNLLNDIDSENKAHLITEDDIDFDDDTRVVFKAKEVKPQIEEDEEEIPQNNEEYQVQSQILYDPKDGIYPVVIDNEMETSFLDYSMSVIVSRALPDARDGLKPVHRRILYDMSELGITPGSQHRKSARIVGDVLGKYHPHGDSSVYDAMVRLAQDFSMRYPLVDGHGNFGSIDGDEAAAMRYTEARMSKIAAEMLEGIKKNTVDFVSNYDETETEPTVLPCRFPNLLVSGASGIAVGMATNIPPHNLAETIDAAIAIAHNPEITVRELMQHIKGPDFPTGATILGVNGIYDAYSTGKGSIPVRAKTEIVETKNGKYRIIVTEIPYALQKNLLIKKIADLVKDKVIEGISDLRDESNREGIRIVIDVKKGYNPDVLLNKLYQKSELQKTFNYSLVAIVNNEPKILTLKEALNVFWDHQKDVVSRRITFDLNKAKERAHILEGLKIAVDNIDEVVRIIRSSKNEDLAKTQLIETFALTEIQAKAILEMRLARLTGLSITKMEEELKELQVRIDHYNFILSSEQNLVNQIIEELNELKEKFADARRTKIDETAVGVISDEDLIPERPIIITATNKGYVKRTDLAEYNAQKRGGMGSSSIKTYQDDDVSLLLHASTHTDILLFSNLGKAYKLRGHEIPEGSKQSKGSSFINILPNLNVELNERIVSILKVDGYDDNQYLATITKNGLFKKTKLDSYSHIRKNGLKAFGLRENDELVRAFIVDNDDVILVANNYKNVVMFKADDVNDKGRNALGVKAITLVDDHRVISASAQSEGELILTLGAKGFGKLSTPDQFSITKRGAKGVTGINPLKAGNLVFARFVNPNDELLVITSSGATIRTFINQISVISRAAKGVKVINLKGDDSIVDVEVITHQDALETHADTEITSQQ
ncbi:DNA gyrase subunit A [Mycoplasma nasistruthionis]|uniref:DNA gyrase subunit A n=1 Tax=Mycoplasma nasistruthionis TaxID=353852 RepID=A0A4Y6I6D5_9MOLU|nr:DNA gyrase subunit A [Mycoplasma nasistruthionis]QDF64870.1 DNA gyrase subunit A [Mycoplasma nasistruthionis]